MGGPHAPGLFGVVPRVLASARDGMWSLLQGALSADEKSRLGVALYDASGDYRDAPDLPWERAWLERALRERPAPCRVLVGAAGAGREAALLAGWGYEITALEPSSSHARTCRENVPTARVIEARYEDLAARRVLTGETFDAVLLGLGSLSHVLDAGVRIELMRALSRACPSGPILASVLAPPETSGDEYALSIGKAARFGRALSSPIRSVRDLPDVESGEIVFGGLGFVKLYSKKELHALGAATGWLVELDAGAPDGMELVTFRQQERDPKGL